MSFTELMKLDSIAVKAVLDKVPAALEEITEFGADPRIDILDSFRAPKVPSISLANYFARFDEYSEASAMSYLLSLIYIERLQQKCDVHLTKIHMHRLALTSWVVASKFWDDKIYTNSVYSVIGGVKRSLLSKLEVEFMCLLGFDLYVTEAEFALYFKRVGVDLSKTDNKGQECDAASDRPCHLGLSCDVCCDRPCDPSPIPEFSCETEMITRKLNQQAAETDVQTPVKAPRSSFLKISQSVPHRLNSFQSFKTTLRCDIPRNLSNGSFSSESPTSEDKSPSSNRFFSFAHLEHSWVGQGESFSFSSEVSLAESGDESS